jgi:predicted TIM-barrel fold metal-dependent hydrolase
MSSRVIDTHTHLYSPEMTPPYWIDAMAAYGSSISSRSQDYVRERIANDWFDPQGDRLIADMDAAGIERSVVFILDFGLYGGVTDAISLMRRYELFAEAIKRHPDRLVLYGGIDPRRPDAAHFVAAAKRDFGIQGVKIWPPAGARPDESYCYRVYERCAELALPVVVHTGQEIGPLRSECTRPIFVDQPANDFPELTFVLAHAGMGWWQEAAEIAWHHPNVYLDIAYWQAKYLRSPERFCGELRALISTAGKHRVMFGTDWPAMRTVRRVKHDTWVRVLRDLPDTAPGGVTFDPEEIDLLLGGAAEAALGL